MFTLNIESIESFGLDGERKKNAGSLLKDTLYEGFIFTF